MTTRKTWHITATLLLMQMASMANTAELVVNLHAANGKPLVLEGAVLYAEPVSTQGVQQAALNRPEVAQRERQFDPYISVIQTGTRVSFPNRDAVSHHVYSFSAAKSFEFPLYRDQSPDPVLFDRDGVVILGCNIHDWMLAYIVVVDTPYFAQFDDQQLRLSLPDGAYQVSLWHPGLNTEDMTAKSVTVAGSLTLDWTLKHKSRRSSQPGAPDSFDESDY